MNHLEIKEQIDSLEKEVNSLDGQCNLLNKQLEDSIIRSKDLQSLQITNQKAIELLHLVKKVTQEKIKEMFEKVVTEALQYIHQSNDYKFALEFGRRGNLTELKFNILTPEMKEFHNIIHTSAGGSRDVVALALRFVISEIMKIPGFLFLDEPEKRLDNPETLQKMIEFVKEMQKETKRQIFVISHKKEFVDSIPNPIIIKAIQKRISTEIKEKPIKKKRGRPRKKKEKLNAKK